MPLPGQISPPAWEEVQLHLHKVHTPSWVSKAAPNLPCLESNPESLRADKERLLGGKGPQTHTEL